MPDYDMCSNKNCPSRKHCLRATAKPSTNQYYAYFPVLKGHEYCYAYKKEDNGR